MPYPLLAYRLIHVRLPGGRARDWKRQGWLEVGGCPTNLTLRTPPEHHPIRPHPGPTKSSADCRQDGCPVAQTSKLIVKEGFSLWHSSLPLQSLVMTRQGLEWQPYMVKLLVYQIKPWTFLALWKWFRKCKWFDRQQPRILTSILSSAIASPAPSLTELQLASSSTCLLRKDSACSHLRRASSKSSIPERNFPFAFPCIVHLDSLTPAVNFARPFQWCASFPDLSTFV